jgi:glycosyltransferase involved in cell wall biosynthesis
LIKNIGVIIIARNEEDHIKNTLESVIAQTYHPYRIICVDDASIDNTSKIIKSYEQVELLKSTTQHESYLGKKELALIINLGLEELKKDCSVDFISILGADTILPKDYFSNLIERMENDEKIAITSGVISNEYSDVPRGSGRMVRSDFWRKIGSLYPVNYGFEAYLVLKAESMGYTTKTYKDLIILSQRKTGSKYSPKLYQYYGMAMKSLGYTLGYAIGKGFLLMLKRPSGGINLIQGYFSKDVTLYDPETRKYVRNLQNNLPFTFYLKRIMKK